MPPEVEVVVVVVFDEEVVFVVVVDCGFAVVVVPELPSQVKGRGPGMV